MKISQEAEDVKSLQEKKVLIDDFEANFKIQGSGPLLLILHGWGGSSDSWVFVQKILAEKGFCVICPDLPGFGKTPPPPEAWSIGDYVEWVKNFCQKQNLSQFSFIGHSFGGGVAVKFAIKYPNFIPSLILIAPAIIRQKKLKQQIYFLLAKGGQFIFSLPILSIFQDSGRKILYKFLGLNDYYKVFLQKSLGMKETFKQIVREDLQKFLPEIKCKTLLIWGEKDRITPLNQAHIVEKRIPNSQLKIIPEIGHVPNFEAPEKLAEIIIQFLRN